MGSAAAPSQVWPLFTVARLVGAGHAARRKAGLFDQASEIRGRDAPWDGVMRAGGLRDRQVLAIVAVADLHRPWRPLLREPIISQRRACRNARRTLFHCRSCALDVRQDGAAVPGTGYMRVSKAGFFAALAAFERELIRERTIARISSARARGPVQGTRQTLYRFVGPKERV